MSTPASRFGFKDRVVVITGAAGGIGKAIVHAFAREDAHLLLTDENALALEDLGRDLSVQGQDALCLAGDLRKSETIEAIAKLAEDRFGQVDCLINNAAAFAQLTRAPIAGIPDEEWSTAIETNLLAAWRLIRALLPWMHESASPAIVNVTSAVVTNGSMHWPHYVASKAALAGLTRGLVRELGNAGVRINSVAPGLVDTPAGRKQSRRAIAGHVEQQAIKSALLPEDVASAVAFLASSASRMVTGQTLIVDGGIDLT